MNRRSVLKLVGGGLVAAAATSFMASNAFANAPAQSARTLALLNTHTGDRFSAAYWEQGNYIPDAMTAIKHVMRDHRNNEVHDIDPRLLDELSRLNGLVGAAAPYQIISGYRSPATNAMLHAN